MIMCICHRPVLHIGDASKELSSARLLTDFSATSVEPSLLSVKKFLLSFQVEFVWIKEAVL